MLPSGTNTVRLSITEAKQRVQTELVLLLYAAECIEAKAELLTKGLCAKTEEVRSILQTLVTSTLILLQSLEILSEALSLKPTGKTKEALCVACGLIKLTEVLSEQPCTLIDLLRSEVAQELLLLEGLSERIVLEA